MGHKNDRFNSFKDAATYLKEEQRPAKVLQRILAEYKLNVSLEMAEELMPYFEDGDTPQETIQNILFNYGIDVSLKEVEHIELLLVDEHHIEYFDTKKKEFVCSDYIAYVTDKWNHKSHYAVQLAKTNVDKTFFEEYYHAIAGGGKTNRPSKAIGQDTIEARKKKDTLLFSRAYADVATKYGQFCLAVEEKTNEYYFGPHIDLSLYYGDHTQTQHDWGKDFNFKEYCLFRWRYTNDKPCNRWCFGFDTDLETPKRYLWEYGVANLNGKEVPLPIYAFENMYNYDKGIIFVNGQLKCKENQKYAPRTPEFTSSFEEYEEMECDSKAYFVVANDNIAVYKIGNKITIDMKSYMSYDCWPKVFSQSLPSKTFGQFTMDDFQQILSIIDSMPMKGRAKISLKDEIYAFLNVHYKEKLDKVSPNFTLEKCNFEKIIGVLKEQDLTKYVEELLEFISRNFYIEMEDLLGKNLPNQVDSIELKKKQES